MNNVTLRREVVTGLIVSRGNKFHFEMKDPKGGGVYADYWHTPGEGIEKKEAQLEALAREMREEMSVDISSAEVTLLDDRGEGKSEKRPKRPAKWSRSE
jgi:ADP-ribose pyrophosphatase YjhB (NUDIX family)